MRKFYSLNYLIMPLLLISIICTIVVWRGTQLPLPPNRENHPAWSPDGKHLAYTCYLNGPIEGESFFDVNFSFNIESTEPWSRFTDEAADICIIDADGSNRVHLVQTAGADFAPTWSPDGTRIAYIRDDEGVFVVSTEENSQSWVIWGGGTVYPRNLAWSPDGIYLLFSACNQKADLEIYRVTVNDGSVVNLTSNDRRQDFSPKWILNGTKVFFRSTSVSARSKVASGICFLLADTPHQMTVINVDGGEERIIYKELYYPYIAVSDGGQIAFASDLISKAEFEYENNNQLTHLYVMAIDDVEPTEVLIRDIGYYRFKYDTFHHLSWWSPDETKLLFLVDGKIRLFDRETTKVKQLPQIISPSFFAEKHIWAPDSQKLAISGSNLNAEYARETIYLIDLQDGTVRPLQQDK